MKNEMWNMKYGKNLISHRGSDCEPRFDKDPFYEYIISDQMDAGDVKGFVVDAGTNVFVNGARGYEVTYKLHTPPGGNDEQIKNWFDVDASTGQIILKQARDHPFPLISALFVCSCTLADCATALGWRRCNLPPSPRWLEASQ